MIKPNVYQIVGSEVGTPLPAYTSIGSYPIVYLTSKDEPMCAECATSCDKEEEYTIISYAGIHWEGPAHNCENCNTYIESAYGDPDCNMRDA